MINASNIRAATESDLAALVQSLAPELARAQLKNRFAEQRAEFRLILVLEHKNELAGTISIDPGVDRDGFTHRLFALDVGQRFRRQGFATQLIRAVEEHVLADGHTTLRLDVAIDNTAAINLYKKLGYEPVGEPTRLQWSIQTDGGSSEVIVDTCQRMVKRLG
jgi:ribosomal protein S18 acetylase RimI-like enzyme